jgi:hypothetical protein
MLPDSWLITQRVFAKLEKMNGCCLPLNNNFRASNYCDCPLLVCLFFVCVCLYFAIGNLLLLCYGMLCYVAWLKRSFVFSLCFAFCSQLRDGRLVILQGCIVWYLTPYTCNSISEGQVSCIFRSVERDVNRFLRKVFYLSARVHNVTAVTSNTLRCCCSMQSRLTSVKLSLCLI